MLRERTMLRILRPRAIASRTAPSPHHSRCPAAPTGIRISVTKVWIWLRWAIRPLRRAELRAVTHQHDAAGVGDDRLCRLHLAIVEIEQRPLLVDGRSGTDDGVIDLELADQLDRRRDAAPCREQWMLVLDLRVPVQHHRDIEIVGDDQQVLVTGQRRGDFGGGAAS